jgi:hypothetical protein
MMMTMILTTDTVDATAWERATGWHLETQGMCAGDRCVPVADIAGPGNTFPVAELAKRTGRPVAHDSARGVWSVGPEAQRPVIGDAVIPDLVLQDRAGNSFSLAQLRERRFVLHAWAPW